MNQQIVLLVAVCLGLLILSLMRFIQTKKQARQKSISGLELINRLMTIIQLTQQHRGMHSGFLNGQQALASKLHSLEAELNDHYNHLSAAQKQFDVRTYQCLQAEQRQWLKLLARDDLNANLSFQLHSSLIKRLLDSLWDMADDFALTTSHNQEVQSLSNQLVRSLPELAESIGQVRALTMQVSNSDRCTPDKKLHLLFTLAKIEQEMAKIPNTMTSQTNQSIQDFVNEVRQCVEQQTLSDRNPDIFFQQATQNIDAIFQYIQQGLNTIKSQLG